MNRLIIYGSHYGTSKRYAKKLASITQIEAKSYEEVKELGSYDQIIFIGGIYALAIRGLKEILKQLPSPIPIIIVTVGLSNPDITSVRVNWNQLVRSHVNEEIYEHAKVFHLRGAIDYKKLSLKHKLMMILAYLKTRLTAKNKRNSDTQQMIETYNTHIDFIDFSQLNVIMNELK